jgi:hypothetical protein
MAGLKTIRALLVTSVFAGGMALAGTAGAGNDTDVPDPESVRAYRDYWTALEEYEARAAAEGQSRLRALYDRLDREENQKRVERTRQQLDLLKAAADKYKRHLSEFPSARNRQYVMLNYANIVDRIASIEQETNADEADRIRREALSQLRDFEQAYPDASLRDDASALRAVMLEKVGSQAEANRVWETLAARPRENQATLAANIAAGDHAFDTMDARGALKYYKRAMAIVESISKNPQSRRMALRARVKVLYRIGWAAYKGAELDETVAAAEELLQPHIDVFGEQERRGIQKDAAELLGDALYETGNWARANKVLARPGLRLAGAQAGLRVMRRLGGGKRFAEAGDLGEFLMARFPNAAEFPWISDLAATAFDQSGKPAKAMAVRAKLADMLPRRSLWRAINRDNIEAVAALDQLGADGARKAAAWYYEDGIQSGSQSSFKTASSIYETLLEENGNARDSNEWRLRIANAWYFQDNLAEARRRYAELKSEYALDRRLLEITSYQDVLAAEKVWKRAAEKAAVAGKKAQDDQDTVASLKQLLLSIDDFASRFPGQNRSVELMLVGASACRDQGLLAEAQKYWQRVLVSTPSAAQRALAIRGLVFAELALSPSSEVVSVVSKFLRLEDWRELGSVLRNEMEGVLSTAALDEGTRLNRDGKVLEAGTLLVQTASENDSVPQREKLLRDGAYLLALGGAWPEAGRIAAKYKKDGMRQFAGDMAYLSARADEFQLRLAVAARSYVDFGVAFPSHTRSKAALERGEKLAAANGDLKTATQAAEVLASRESRREDQLKALSRAIKYAMDASAFNAAHKLAAARLKVSRDLPERYESQWLLGKIDIERGDEQQGIDNLEILAKRIEQDRDQLGDSFAPLSGAVNLYLARHFQKKLDAIRADSNDPQVAAVVSRNLKLFDEVLMRFDRAAASGDRESAPMARYLAGVAAEEMADDVEKLGKAGGDAKSRENSARLKTLARSYFSANLVAQRKNPAIYKGNEWMSRAALKLDPADKSAVSGTIGDEVPISTMPDMPAQWQL